MLKMRFEIYASILFALFYFSEGKPCPEKTRPHKTLCEAYYKCFELPSKRHVWVPEKCESGLIYEHNLGLCVLPDDEWECMLGVGTSDGKIEDNAEIKASMLSPNQKQKPATKNEELYIINNKHEDEDDDAEVTLTHHNEKSNDKNMEVIMNTKISREEDETELSDDIEIESSGDGVGELMELDGFLQAENRETEDQHLEQINEDDENEIVHESTTKKSKIDPKLTAHLQRLSQLIDGLKAQYQKGDEEQMELRPDQLNAFLAHFNIQNKFSLIKPTIEVNSKEKLDIAATTTEAPESTTTTYAKYQTPSKNKTLLQEHLDNKLKPETKVVLTNSLSKHYDATGYSNSQIVVNRPEGSVLFALPHFGSEQTTGYGHNTPKISEETLKTVLELSKQMIATQNIPKILPNTGYYTQPLIQPLFLPASAFQTQAQTNPFASYFHDNNNNNHNNQQADYDGNGNNFGQFGGSYTNKLTGHKQLLQPASGYNKPGNTIIHNNVIPVHLTSTNSGEKEIVDSYGQSLGLFPPLHTDDRNGYRQHYLHTHNFGDNKFLATPHPQISTTPPPSYAAQYAAYPTELGATTGRPIDFSPTSPALSEYFSPSPHLNDNNVNKLFQSTDRYPTVQYDDLPRPMNMGRPSLFTPQTGANKVKVRPNGHKIESMEIEADDYNDNHARPLPQLFTYNYDNDKLDIGNQYQQSMYGSSGLGSNKHSYEYMPRPPATRPTYTNAANKLKPYNTHSSSSYTDGTQLVNMGGNFVSFDVFQNTILPLLGQSQSLNELNNVEVITCATGVRQPNSTDCTRYYVCSKKDGKVLSYSCPPYTAFNAQSRICDAHTYAVCTPDAIASSYTVNENKRLQLEAIKTLQNAKRRQEQALKAQNIANQQEESGEKDMLDAYVQQAAAMSAYNTTPKPTAAAPVKKRRYYCKEGDKIADQTSTNSYFVCYKNAQGMMKGHKMTCTKSLIFCSKTSLCTLASKCA